jgi:hypothetical protein
MIFFKPCVKGLKKKHIESHQSFFYEESKVNSENKETVNSWYPWSLHQFCSIYYVQLSLSLSFYFSPGKYIIIIIIIIIINNKLKELKIKFNNLF